MGPHNPREACLQKRDEKSCCGLGEADKAPFPLPTPSVPHPLKLLVKKAFGLAFGAPEIVLNMWGKLSLDPDLRWIIACVRLLRYMCSTDEGKWIIGNSPDRVPGSRLSALRTKLADLGWSFDARYIYLPEQTALRRKRDDLRDRIVLAKLVSCVLWKREDLESYPRNLRSMQRCCRSSLPINRAS